jgi:outer membrane autotransporter protein
MFGYSDKEVDFDSSLSIVDAKIDSSGYSLQLYVLYEGERAYASTSLGYQWMDHDVRRRIVYPSNNANIPATDSTALSSTDSKTLLATFGAGYQFRWGGLSAEPYVDIQYSDTRVDGFTERSFSNVGEPGPDAFALAVGRQDIDSLDTSIGLRFQYVFTPTFGVLVPYLRGAYHLESRDDARVISTRYAGASDLLGTVPGSDFALSTDRPDDDYYTVAAGFSVVLPNGLQGFLQYLEVLDLDFYNQSVVSAGVRFEF